MKVAALLLDGGDENALSAFIREFGADVVPAWSFSTMEEMLEALTGYELVIMLKRDSYIVGGTWTAGLEDALRKGGHRVLIVSKRT